MLSFPSQKVVLGESAWSILWKICIDNQISYRHLTKLISKVREFHYVSQIHNEVFPLEGARILINFDPKYVMYADPVKYFPNFRIAARLTLRQLRICPHCIKQGVHLLAHQFVTVRLCPVHLKPLKRIPCDYTTYFSMEHKSLLLWEDLTNASREFSEAEQKLYSDSVIAIQEEYSKIEVLYLPRRSSIGRDFGTWYDHDTGLFINPQKGLKPSLIRACRILYGSLGAASAACLNSKGKPTLKKVIKTKKAQHGNQFDGIGARVLFVLRKKLLVDLARRFNKRTRTNNFSSVEDFFSQLRYCDLSSTDEFYLWKITNWVIRKCEYFHYEERCKFSFHRAFAWCGENAEYLETKMKNGVALISVIQDQYPDVTPQEILNLVKSKTLIALFIRAYWLWDFNSSIATEIGDRVKYKQSFPEYSGTIECESPVFARIRTGANEWSLVQVDTYTPISLVEVIDYSI